MYGLSKTMNGIATNELLYVYQYEWLIYSKTTFNDWANVSYFQVTQMR